MFSKKEFLKSTSTKVFTHYFIEKEKNIVPKKNSKPASKLFEDFNPI